MNTRDGQALPLESVPASHPSLPGHFPGEPVVPGVVLLERILAGIAQQGPGSRPTGFAWVKFHLPVAPGQRLQLQLDPAGSQQRFHCLADGELAVSGELRYGGA